MDKYALYCFKYENIHKIKSNIKDEILMIKYYNFIFNHYGIKECIKSIKNEKRKTLKLFVVGYALFNKELRIWIKENLLDKMEKDSLIKIFIEHICNVSYNKKMCDLAIESFKLSDLIKDVEKKDDMFIMTTIDNDKIKFKPSNKTKKEKDIYKGECHNIGYNFFKVNNEVSEYECITILENTLYGYTRYHTFLYREGIIYDLARNVIMKYSDYEKLFKFKVLFKENGNKMLENINELEEKDKIFKKSNYHKVLKYAMYNQSKNTN